MAFSRSSSEARSLGGTVSCPTTRQRYADRALPFQGELARGQAGRASLAAQAGPSRSVVDSGEQRGVGTDQRRVLQR